MSSRRLSNCVSASTIAAFRSKGRSCGAGKRASVENSSTSCRTVSTEAGDCLGAAGDHRPRGFVGSPARDVAPDAFRRKRYWGKRVLDLVGDSPRHLPPGRLFLRLQQLREIFKYYDVSEPLARSNRPAAARIH